MVDEHHSAAAVDGDIVHVEVTGGVGHARHVEPVIAVVRLLLGQRIVETPELRARAHVEAIGAHTQAHGAVEVPLEGRETAVGFEPDQKETVGLVRREGQADARLVQPGEEVARSGDLQGWRVHRRCLQGLRVSGTLCSTSNAPP